MATKVSHSSFCNWESSCVLICCQERQFHERYVYKIASHRATVLHHHVRLQELRDRLTGQRNVEANWRWASSPHFTQSRQSWKPRIWAKFDTGRESQAATGEPATKCMWWCHRYNSIATQYQQHLGYTVWRISNRITIQNKTGPGYLNPIRVSGSPSLNPGGQQQPGWYTYYPDDTELTPELDCIFVAKRRDWRARMV